MTPDLESKTSESEALVTTVSIYAAVATRSYSREEAFGELQRRTAADASYYDEHESTRETDDLLTALSPKFEEVARAIGAAPSIQIVLEGARLDRSMWPPFPLTEVQLVAELSDAAKRMEAEQRVHDLVSSVVADFCVVRGFQFVVNMRWQR